MPNNNYQLIWDQWSTATVKSDSWAGAYEGLGFSQAYNHPNLLLIALLRGQGRAAEYLGQHSGAGPNAITKQPVGIDYLQSDRLVWQLDIANLGQVYWHQQSEQIRTLVQAYCTGINACRQAHPERFDERLLSVPSVTPEMVMAHVAHIMVGFQVMLRQPSLVQWMQGGQPVVPSWQSFAGAGSNGCVIGPNKSQYGHPMLVCNPHTQWDVDLNSFTETRLEVAGSMTLHGAGMVGWPGMMMGCNGHSGYTATVNTQSSLSLYQVQLEGDHYLLDDEPQLVQRQTRQIACLEADGSVSHHPQLQTYSPLHDAYSLAQRGEQHLFTAFAGRGRGGVLQQLFDMSTAPTVAAFKQALQQHQLPLFNILYAGRDADTQEGHIHYSFHSLPPERGKGTWADWWQVLDGHQSSNIATGITPYAALFQHQDAASGWYQNCNDSPYSCTLPSPFNPEDYPAWLAPVYTNFRAQSYNRLMSETDKFDLASFQQAKFSTRVELAAHVLPDLLNAIEQAAAPSDLLTKAARVLREWDQHMQPDSRGAYLFLHWLLQLDTQDAAASPLFKDAWQWSLAADPERCLEALNVPNRLADCAVAIAALEAAGQLLMNELGCLDVAWGEAVKIQHGKVVIDAIGGPGDPLGVVAAVPVAPHLRPFIKGGQLPSNRIENEGGETFVMVVQFTPEGAEGGTLMSYGNSSDCASEFYGDQLRLLADRQMKPFTISIN